MYFWNINALSDGLRNKRITEQEKSQYLLAFIIIIVVYGEVSSHICFESQVTLYRILQSLIIVTINFFGVVYCYRTNSHGDNNDFVARFICISLPVTMRLLAFTAILLIVLSAVYFYIFGIVTVHIGFIMEFVYSTVYYLWVRTGILNIASGTSGTHNTTQTEKRANHTVKPSLIGAILQGFIVGVVGMEIVSRPARRAYREMLQNNYVISQSSLAREALKDGNNLRAMVHL